MATRAYGATNPTVGDMFDENKLLIDPYSRALAGHMFYSRKAAQTPPEIIMEKHLNV